MLSILMVCGNGCGSSLICQMTVESVLKDLGVKAHIDHSDMLSASSKQADILIAGINFQPHFDKFKDFPNKIYLKSLVSKDEIRTKLEPLLKENGWL
ncbi:PTS sugar transporter subunit IIB [Youxingia wuxianensis]|uniref:PTS sugar transporter subunit IIB n=1 Tax=Youxingia wuxianensis TaxID=2763678 RepID=UPI0021CC6946|nr:PTS sugar transporter subunit IIB [Youxingia wuxianensis]